jgi:ethanolamine ammonia-lyase small subunit
VDKDDPSFGLSVPAPPGGDSWTHLRRFTPARIALGRAGGSRRTAELLDFRLAHARARDAVIEEFHPGAVVEALERMGFASLSLSTGAGDRQSYLLRPDLGRTLAPESRKSLENGRFGWGARDVAVIVSDGLSALAAERHASAVLGRLLPLLGSAGWTIFPVFVAPFARVKLQDEVGATVGARHSLMLLGERPGLGSPDSLGAYFTFRPHPDRTDADRNCVSNIRPEGLAPGAAAAKLAHLLLESARLAVSGVALKDSQAGLRA